MKNRKNFIKFPIRVLYSIDSTTYKISLRRFSEGLRLRHVGMRGNFLIGKNHLPKKKTFLQ